MALTEDGSDEVKIVVFFIFVILCLLWLLVYCISKSQNKKRRYRGQPVLVLQADSIQLNNPSNPIIVVDSSDKLAKQLVGRQSKAHRIDRDIQLHPLVSSVDEPPAYDDMPTSKLNSV
uniref:Uncharacterized protein n=1 Tax=Plectus sambesii TaxID=2011161 RepID=A0A914XK03_9BILA